MSSDIPLQIAETVQTAHIKRHPSPAHDINPSTAASKKVPVTIEKKQEPLFPDGIDDGDEDDEEGGVPYGVLKPKPRRHHLPPIPDLRYEQSYLHSIRNADKWWKVVLITARDQVSFFSFSLSGWDDEAQQAYWFTTP